MRKARIRQGGICSARRALSFVLTFGGLLIVTPLAPPTLAGSASGLVVHPGALNFGKEVFGVHGATSKPRTVTVLNPKGKNAQPVAVSDSLTGNDMQDFTVLQLDQCNGAVIEPGDHCTISLSFTPTSTGMRTATLSISSVSSAAQVKLAGVGIAGPLLIKPRVLSFGKVQVGTTSPGKSVTIVNHNSVALSITGITAANDTFVPSLNCLGTLSAGGTCQISVSFAPTNSGKRKKMGVNGVLVIADDAARSPQRVRLTGVAFGAAPPPQTSTGSGSLATLTIKGVTYALAPVLGGIAQVPLISSGVSAAREFAQRVAGSSVAGSEAQATGLGASPDPALPVFYSLSPQPDACASDQDHLRVLCASFDSATVNLIDLSQSPPAIISSDLSRSAGNGIETSGGPCVICGVAYDPSDKAFILADANGYQLFSEASLQSSPATTPTPAKTIAANIAENFGYNPATNRIFSPEEARNRIDLVDVGSGKLYSLTGPTTPYPANLSVPDAGDVDANTNIGITANEYGGSSTGQNEITLVPLNSAILGAPGPGMFSDNNTAQFDLVSSLGSCPPYMLMVDEHANDPVSHLEFFSSEFCGPSSGLGGQATIGVAQLPSSGSGTPTIPDYVFAPMPNQPDGKPWTSSGDPHGISVLALPGSEFGALENWDKTFVATADLKKLLPLARSAADAHLVDPGVDLLADGVVAFRSICGLQNSQPQPRPVQLGVSGGNMGSIGGGSCCTGTLGSLVQDSSGDQFVLSNNHVLVAPGSSPIVQPGLADASCVAKVEDGVASVKGYVSLSGKETNSVDAAIASVVSGDVDPSGAMANIGPISSEPAISPMPGLAVQKVGRTTCLTRGEVEAVDVTTMVSYASQCDASFAGTAKFTHQIEFGPAGFSDHGDSGSLIVTRDPCPRPVALLFAGGNGVTFGNPINNVLDALGPATGLTISFVGSCSMPLSASGRTPGHSAQMDDERSATTRTGIQAAIAVKAYHERELLNLSGVVGVGVGFDQRSAQPVIEVYVLRDARALRARIPSTLDGVPVRIKETGIISAY